VFWGGSRVVVWELFAKSFLVEDDHGNTLSIGDYLGLDSVGLGLGLTEGTIALKQLVDRTGRSGDRPYIDVAHAAFSTSASDGYTAPSETRVPPLHAYLETIQMSASQTYSPSAKLDRRVDALTASSLRDCVTML
jgi:hypothetical protein